jgi:O-antigen/teichoic acid export membrane protein
MSSQGTELREADGVRDDRALARRGAQLVRRAAASGAPPLIISIIAVQGFSALAQLVVARVVAPADFGIVRAVEVVITMLLLIASVGMPSLAIRDVALATEEERPLVLGRLVALAAMTSVVVALVAIVGAPLLVPPVARPYLRAMAAAVCLTASSRTAMNYFQGVQRVSVLAKLSAISSTVAFLAFVLLVHWLGMRGWVIGRYVGELSLLLFTLIVLGRRISFAGVFEDMGALWRTWKRGMVISASFVVRTVHENSPTLALTWFGAVQQVGFYGLAALLLTPLLLLPSVIGNLAVPRFALLMRQPHHLQRDVTRLSILTTAVAALGALFAVLVVPAVITRFFPSYAPALALLGILVLCVPLRALNGMIGSFLMAYDRNDAGLVINGISLAIAFGGCLLLIPTRGAKGAAIAILIADCCSAAMWVTVAQRFLRAIPVPDSSVAVNG